MHPDLSISPQEESERISKFIKTAVHNAGYEKVVVGLSGGIDSAVSTALAVKALGVENVHIGIFPYGDLNKEGENDALELINHFQPKADGPLAQTIQPSNHFVINIKPIVDHIINLDPDMDNFRKGNIMARIRMILLYDLSKKIPALVVGTENKTEHLLGYFTRFGDSASDIEPITHLYKTQVRQLAEYLKIPRKIIDQAPTAGLWQGQTDEGEFGFSYEEGDKILSLHADNKMGKEEIIKSGFDKNLVDKVINRLKEKEFKHKLPYRLIESKKT